MGTQTLVPNQYRLHKWDGPLELKETGGAMVTGNIAVIPPDDADVRVESLSVTENGTYTAPEGTAYSPVTVNVAGGGGLVTPWCCEISGHYTVKMLVFDKSATVSVRISDETYRNIVSAKKSPYTDIVSTQGDLTILAELPSDIYIPVELSESDNPTEMGLYDYTENIGYIDQTSDTTVDPSKTYYERLEVTDESIYLVEQGGNTYEHVCRNSYSWTEGQLSPVQP